MRNMQPNLVSHRSGTCLAILPMFGLRWSTVAGAVLLVSTGLTTKPAAAQEAPLNPVLDVGVVQRFGSDSKDVITLKPEAGDRLTVQLQAGNREQTFATTAEVKVEVAMQPLAEPKLVERVVLSTHRSFESAEDSANQWRAQGVEVEIAQPRQWQVWAKRETYETPLLRRLLMQNVRSQGARTAFIDTQVQQQEPQATLTINGTTLQSDEFKLDTANDRVEVTFNRDDHGRRLYAGTLTLQPNAYGTYTLVNHVPVEAYLRGVVPHEIGASAPQAAIEAQAILARTYALRNLRRFAIDNYQLCADTQCQVYWGISGADPRTDRAINATRGQVLTYRNELVDALYSSTTGGITAPFSDVWNGSDRPYLKAVVDSVQNVWDLSQQSLSDEANFRAFISRKSGFNEDGWEMFRWRIESSLTEIASDLKSYLQSKQHPLANFTQVQDMKVLERSAAGRVQRVLITTDRGEVILEKDEILRALYAPNSTLFYLEPVYQTVTPQSQTTSSSKPTNSQVAQVNLSPSPNPTLPRSFAQTPTPQTTPIQVLKGFAFVGGGFGHGVGMSQTGAYHLGDLGWTSSQILNFYYPTTQLKPLTPEITFWRETPVEAAATVAPTLSPGATPMTAPATPRPATTTQPATTQPTTTRTTTP